MRKRDVREGAGHCGGGIRKPLWPLSLPRQWDTDAEVINHLEETGNPPLLPYTLNQPLAPSQVSLLPCKSLDLRMLSSKRAPFRQNKYLQGES